MKSSLTAYLLLLPGLLLLAVFVLVPMGYGVWLSLHEFNGIVVGAWVGVDHYLNVLADPAFRGALRHTLVFAVLVVVGKNIAGLALALLVNLPLRGMRAARTLLFLPVTLNIIVIGAFWTLFLSAGRFGGLLNQTLEAIGLGALAQSWLGEPGIALVSVSLVEVWRWAGLHMLIFLAGMQAIDPSLYDAARLDGAGAWRRLWNVTLPQLRPLLFVSTLLALMGAFVRSFDVVWVLTRGGFGTDVLMTRLYNTAFRNGEFDRATAMGFIVLAVIAIVSLVFAWLARKAHLDDAGNG